MACVPEEACGNRSEAVVAGSEVPAGKATVNRTATDCPMVKVVSWALLTEDMLNEGEAATEAELTIIEAEALCVKFGAVRGSTPYNTSTEVLKRSPSRASGNTSTRYVNATTDPTGSSAT